MAGGGKVVHPTLRVPEHVQTDDPGYVELRVVPQIVQRPVLHQLHGDESDLGVDVVAKELQDTGGAAP